MAFLLTDAQIKKLLPLGFSRKAIRRELFLSDGDLDAAASRLLDKERGQLEGEGEREEEELSGGGLDEGGGWEEEVDGESSDEVMETQGEKKTFSVGSIEVSDS